MSCEYRCGDEQPSEPLDQELARVLMRQQRGRCFLGTPRRLGLQHTSRNPVRTSPLRGSLGLRLRILVGWLPLQLRGTFNLWELL
eukprot:3769910-Prymnesium_polylepis.1